MKIIIAGDYCPRNRVQEKIDNGLIDDVLSDVKTVVEQADYSIVNLECPVAHLDKSPIKKCGSFLKTNEVGIGALKWAGFKCVTLANNHFLDYGENGVRETMSTLNSYGIDFVGGGSNIKEAARILYKDVGGQKLAIINCCEHEFSIATDSSGGSNPLNTVEQYYAIKEAKKNADWVIVIVHGGHEHFRLPSLRMVESYRFFIDAGADAVINHHQHCFSGYELYNNKPIFYGLGNFCFDIRPVHYKTQWNYGYMVQLIFGDGSIKYEILPYEQCSDMVGVKMLPKDSIKDDLERLNMIISNNDLLTQEVKKYYQMSRREMISSICPIENRLYRALVSRGVLPDMISFKRKLRLENRVCCESHRDKLQYFFNGRLK
jgi:poly-gamma-glutamate synthesis protein (capsule biosynthesis protein)